MSNINRRGLGKLALSTGLALAIGLGVSGPTRAEAGEIVYLTPGLDVAFWRYVSAGVESVVSENGYVFQALDSQNDAQKQLRNAQDAIVRGVAGIVISPTDSATAPAVLELAKEADIPVVIADIGTTEGEHVSFVASNNYEGAYGVGKALAAALKEKGWEDGTVGIVAISQVRLNGQARTKGFKDALAEEGITGDAGLQQMQAYTPDETFRFVQDMIVANPDMRAIFVQTDGPTLGALEAIRAARKTGEIMVAAFDGIPEFVPLLQSGDLVVSGMQQPYEMGAQSARALFEYINGGKPDAEYVVPILPVSSANIDEMLPKITVSVFAGDLN